MARALVTYWLVKNVREGVKSSVNGAFLRFQGGDHHYMNHGPRVEFRYEVSEITGFHIPSGLSKHPDGHVFENAMEKAFAGTNYYRLFWSHNSLPHYGQQIGYAIDAAATQALAPLRRAARKPTVDDYAIAVRAALREVVKNAIPFWKLYSHVALNILHKEFPNEVPYIVVEPVEGTKDKFSIVHLQALKDARD